MSNSLDTDQAQPSVGPDLGPNCLQKLSADDTCPAYLFQEMTKKTTDYLMTHVINKDNDVSLAAIETLEPLLKQSHTCLLKHKQKLRTVGKTTSCPRVQEICHQLVPDIHNKGWVFLYFLTFSPPLQQISSACHLLIYFSSLYLCLRRHILFPRVFVCPSVCLFVCLSQIVSTL